jgi:hypothetical protein
MKSVAIATDEIKSVLFIPHVIADFIAKRFHHEVISPVRKDGFS